MATTTFQWKGWKVVSTSSVSCSKIRKVLGQRACKESLKRDEEVLVLADELKAQGNVDENTRAMITPVLKRIRKIMEEGEAAKEHRTGRCNKKTSCGKNSKSTLPRGTQRRDGRVP